MFPGWGPGAFGGFPAGLFGDQQFDAPYSDDENYVYRGNRHQRAARGPHRQPIKTGRDPNRHHAAAEGQRGAPSTRSAPTSPHYGHPHDPNLFQHQQQQHQAYQHQQEARLRQQQQEAEACRQRQQEALLRQQQQEEEEARLRHQHQSSANATMSPVSAGRKAHGASAAAQAGSYGPHPAAAGTSKAPSSASKPRSKPLQQLSPDAAATRIQTAWRAARLARHKPALKQLATAASQLRQYTEQLQEVQRSQPGQPLTQKQYLEMSEPVMKVLFALDAVTCGSAVELRSKRKDLTTRANQLLDAITAAHKAPPNPAAAAAAAAARGGGSSSAGAQPAAAAAPAAQQQHQAKPKKHWFRRN